ncbi:flagellar basal body-associated FliL family protein [Fontimonas sp. SYSU GA230001]|uniref:flagellar basal body-associated FliL family protein n=1 Tax=Fontimonas sp. SYSU GA230001 TaxID=3142450 RepID=UPI0032B58689
MAKDDEDTPAQAAKPEAPAKKGIGAVGLIIAIVLSVAASAGVSWFLIHGAVSELKSGPADEVKAEEPPKLPTEPANYVSLDPAFVVNIEGVGGSRFLQIQIEVMTRNPKSVELVQRHAPRIRSALLLLLGQQKAEVLQTREGKEALQAQVLTEINGILKAETGKADIEAVYFTSFVIQ